MTSDLIQVSTAYVKSRYEGSEDTTLHYHNWEHTNYVFNAAMEIARNTAAVSVEQQEEIGLAAIFHDVGYIHSSVEHEKRSTEIATDFLTEKGVDANRIEVINRLIMATKMGHEPGDLLEQVIQDADFSHLGSPDYLETFYIGLYHEVKEKHHPEMTENEWATMSKEFVQNHRYHTEYAKTNYKPLKETNICKMDENLPDTANEHSTQEVVAKVKKPKKKAKKKPDLPEKGVETMFRVALRNHMNLSRIADNKANTLISVNGIIISIVLSALFPKMDSNPYLIYPGLFLISFSIVTIIIAIFSTIPKTTHGLMTKKEVEEKKGNLIFFGNFHNMSLEDYEWGISELMKDKDYLYKSLTRDLYFLGKVLNKKYKLLRWSYYIFVIGLVISIGMFVASTNAIAQ